MQRLRVEKWCDLCFHEQEEYVVSTGNYTVSVSSNGRTPLVRVVDVCDTHDKSIEDFRKLIQRVGVTRRAAKPDATDRSVQEFREMVERRPTVESAEAEEGDAPANKHRPAACPDCGRVLAHGVPAHLVRTHGYRPIKQPARCPDCKKPASSPASMVMHRVKVHGYDLSADIVARQGRKDRT